MILYNFIVNYFASFARVIFLSVSNKNISKVTNPVFNIKTFLRILRKSWLYQKFEIYDLFFSTLCHGRDSNSCQKICTDLGPFYGHSTDWATTLRNMIHNWFHYYLKSFSTFEKFLAIFWDLHDSEEISPSKFPLKLVLKYLADAGQSWNQENGFICA